MTLIHSPFTLSPLSVAGLVDYIRSSLEDDPNLQQVAVVGEVSSTTPHQKGLFFNLSDPEQRVTVNCVVWRSQWPRLTSLPSLGEQVLVQGTVTVYAQRSSYQLTVWQVLPLGDGLKAWRCRQLKQRLQAEGLFDLERKRPLPSLAQTIAVVSSPQAAAWGDIQRSLQQHHPGLRVLFSPATVQGEMAPPSILQAIQRVVRDGRAEVLILARGGGASEDLECFDDERVVRAVVECPIPVVTGIGHQRDESLADLAADLCAHTPTAAALAAVPALADLITAHGQRRDRLLTLITAALGDHQDHLALFRQRLQRLRLDQQLQQYQVYLGQLRGRLCHGVQMEVRQAQDRCSALGDRLRGLNPAIVLRRGYALVRDQRGKVVMDASTVDPDAILNLDLAQGGLTVQVIAIHPSASIPSTTRHAP
ncbi:MAG: exodeoxyribonuclease VII large subunit [Cyanobacteriota bacterium]|nr:exodeoxyribonuclease VII large subunit [Cyanobacteriota bacterium]